MSNQDLRSFGRRGALSVLAGAACLPLAGGPPGAQHQRWTGRALGGRAEMLFADTTSEAAQQASAAAQAEIDRLDAVFSLWRGDSELSRLNQDGRLAAPSLDLRIVLGQALDLARASGGAFDPTVQPLWQAYAELAAAGVLAGRDALPAQVDRARQLVDWRGVRIAGGRIALARPGMAVTLNGIAQGYIADRVADLLHRRGFGAVLVQLGETYALGRPPGRDAWRLTGAGADWRLADRALATSAGAGSPFTADGRFHHLLDPHSGDSARRFRAVSVAHDSAALADGLSTALAVLPAARGQAVLESFGGTAHWQAG